MGVAMSEPRILDRQLLEAYADELGSRGVPVDTWTTPPATDEAIDRAFTPLEVHVPDEVRVLWAWHDGEPSDGSRRAWLGAFTGHFLSVDEAAHQYRGLCTAM